MVMGLGLDGSGVDPGGPELTWCYICNTNPITYIRFSQVFPLRKTFLCLQCHRSDHVSHLFIETSYMHVSSIPCQPVPRNPGTWPRPDTKALNNEPTSSCTVRRRS